MSSCCAPAGPGLDLPLLQRPAATGAGPGPDVVWFRGGRSHVGTTRPMIPADGEGPRREVMVGAFGIEPTAVSTADFARFADATGYVTEAERFGWSFVFVDFLPPDLDVPVAEGTPWWARCCTRSRWKTPALPVV